MIDDNNKEIALGASRQHILNSPAYSPSTVFCFEKSQAFGAHQIALRIRKDFKFLGKVNEIIRHLFEGGLFVKWDRDNKRKRKYEIPFIVKRPIQLKYFNTGSGFVLSGGFIMASLTFVLELIISKKLKQKNEHRIWKYLERSLDGRRYYLKNLTK